jgi:hypothetical protein
MMLYLVDQYSYRRLEGSVVILQMSVTVTSRHGVTSQKTGSSAAQL